MSTKITPPHGLVAGSATPQSRVFQNFVAWLAGPAMTLFDAGALAPVPLTIPGTGTVLAFEGAVDGNGKARLAAQMSDGAVWVYDQP